MTSTPRAERPGPPTIGGYRLLSPIGEGGMGVVHLAEDEQGRRVALKVLRPQVVGDDEGRRRLEREVASLRHVRSPHVAEVIDADPWGEHPFIVTRYVPGHSLFETVDREGPLRLPDLLHTAHRLLEAVRDVHAAGVLHRDLKPTNVVMEGRSPILIDFGLARLAEDPRLTMTGTVLGTPGYLAPEVLYGDEATAATDVHGWAATTAYAATGRPPYGRGHTMAILDRTRRGEVDLSGVPTGLAELLAGCLAGEPVDRPTVTEVLAELDSLGSELAAADLPTASLATVPPLAAAPDHTMPWQTVPREEPGTVVVPQAAEPRTDVLPVSGRAGHLPDPTTIAPTPQPTSQFPAAAPAGPVAAAPVAAPPYRVAAQPAPPYANPWPPGGVSGQPAGHRHPGHPNRYQPAAYPAAPVADPRRAPWAQPRLDSLGRLRRAALLGALGVVTVAAHRIAPYVTYLSLLVVVAGLRGAARTQESLWRRRAFRGRRWSDAPRAAVAFPWHTVLAGVVSVLNVLSAAVVTALVVAVLVVGGMSGRNALVVGGVVTVLAVWWGPGSRRLRSPVGQGATALARRPPVGWTAVTLAVAVAAGFCVTAWGGSVEWWPSTSPPWTQLQGLLPHALQGRI